jgi:hypothetical protein
MLKEVFFLDFKHSNRKLFEKKAQHIISTLIQK